MQPIANSFSFSHPTGTLSWARRTGTTTVGTTTCACANRLWTIPPCCRGSRRTQPCACLDKVRIGECVVSLLCVVSCNASCCLLCLPVAMLSSLCSLLLHLRTPAARLFFFFPLACLAWVRFYQVAPVAIMWSPFSSRLQACPHTFYFPHIHLMRAFSHVLACGPAQSDSRPKRTFGLPHSSHASFPVFFCLPTDF